MITEKHFALSHAAFWHQLLPTAESYVRECNTEANRFREPLASSLPADQRGMINELAFRLFAAASRSSGCAAQLSAAVREDCVREARDHILRMREGQRAPARAPGEADLLEALVLAARIEQFFKKAAPGALVVFPAFRGCGWLDACQADVLADGVLFEVKAGERGFRSIDLRQVLCYCALDFAAKSYDIRDVCLVNPRSGRYVSETLERLCQRTAGRTAVEVLGDIVEYVSEPPGRYSST